jgi:hypothetical protein
MTGLQTVRVTHDGDYGSPFLSLGLSRCSVDRASDVILHGLLVLSFSPTWLCNDRGQVMTRGKVFTSCVR